MVDVTVIDRAQIETAAGRTLVEFLAQQPGIQYSSNGGLGKNASLYIRGLEFRHILVLIDGVRHGSATTGTPSLSNLPLELIERIEIVRGPLSGLYGSDAVAGVIQIFTRKGGEGLKANAHATVGSNRYGRVGGGLRFGQDALSGSVQVQHEETKGFSATNDKVPFGNFNPDRDGFRQESAQLQLGLKLTPDWHADLHVLHADGTTHYDDGPSADSRAGLRSDVQSLQFSGPVTSAWRSTVRIGRTREDYTTLASANRFTSLGTIGTVQRMLSWENTVSTAVGSVVLVADHLQQEVERPGTPYAVSKRTINGVAAGLNGHVSRHTWQANLRRDKNSQFGEQTTGSLGYGFDLTQAWRIAASAGTSFVAPSFNQLYWPGFGNPDLRPEKGKHGELGLQWAQAQDYFKIAYFDNRIRGYISSGTSPTNIPRARVDGVSLSYGKQLANWTLSASAEHVDPRNDTRSSSNWGHLLPRRSRDSARAAADVDLGAWRLGASLNASGHRYDNAANTTRLGGFTSVDLRADWRIQGPWSAQLRLNNASDKRYETVYGYNQPGREVYLTLRYSGQ